MGKKYALHLCFIQCESPEAKIQWHEIVRENVTEIT